MAETEEELKRVLVVGAHPDDPDVGAAGTVALWVQQGKEVYYLLVTNGDKGSSDPAMTSEKLIAIRRAEQERAAAKLGVKEVIWLGYRDGELEHSLALRKDITHIIRQYRPDIVITHDPTILFVQDRYLNHPDHRVTGLATLDAIFPTARDRLQYPDQIAAGLVPHKVRHIYLFTPQQRNVSVDITSVFESKLEALKEHKSQFDFTDEWVKFWRERARAQGDGDGYYEAFHRIIMFR